MNRFLLIALGISLVNAYPSGAPIEACVDLTPQHGFPPQSTPSPYSLVAVNNGDGTYQVSVEKSDAAAADFKGFLIQARAAGSTVPVGSFQNVPADAHTVDCSGVADSVTHSINNTRTTISIRWAPAGPVDGISFYGTVVQVFTTFWTGLVSQDLGTLP